MPNKPADENSHSFYYTPQEKLSKLGFFSGARVVLRLKKILNYIFRIAGYNFPVLQNFWQFVTLFIK